MTQLVNLTKQAHVGVVALNNPPVNVLSHPVRAQLLAVMAAALADREIHAIVLRCEGRTFVAGADIREFGQTPLSPDVPEVIEFVESATKPVIAALHGTALGGGLELALACHFRVAVAGAKLGFPEVTLGILPGAGGTQRLPRVVGVRAALDMIVGGAPIGAPRAHALGLIDAIVPGDLAAGALVFAERLLDDHAMPRRASAASAQLEDPSLFEEYGASIREQCRGLLAPFHCIRAIRAAVELPFAEGLQRERELFVELLSSPQSKALRHVFFSERESTKVPGAPAGTREIASAAVIGAGPLGTGIAICFADARIPVHLLDVSPEALERGRAALREHYEKAVATARLPAQEMDERLARVQPTLSFDTLADADVVIETVSGDLSVKREVFAKLDAVCKPSAVLATTASNLDLAEIAAASKRPADVVGLQFSNPPASGKLVEVARAGSTSPEVCATALKLARTLGKLPVLGGVRAGFVGNRMFARYLGEAVLLLEEGALREQVDRVLYDFGFPMGPLAVAERDGLDHEALRVRHAAERRIQRRTLQDDEILERCMYALIHEGARILDESPELRPRDVDLICVHGHGFPRHRGGPLFYADQLGPGRVERTLLELQRRDPEWWPPAPLVARLSLAGTGFYDAR